MIRKSFLQKIKKDLETYQKERNQIIGSSREILQASKKAIFALQAGKTKEAQLSLTKAEQGLKTLDRKYNKDNRLRFEGSYKAALEEYVEAKTFSLVLAGKNLADFKLANIGPEEYLGGLADLTGELVRQAVLQATRGNQTEIARYRDVCQEVVAFLLDLYLTGSLRQKFDDAKRNLKRLEQIIYDLSLRN